MRFNLMALSIAAGLLWGSAILLVGLANLIWPAYGRAFLDLAASVYPGYVASRSVGQVIFGGLYGFMDGAVGGFIFGWLYNFTAEKFTNRSS